MAGKSEQKEDLAEIGLILYPDALLSAVYGLTDLFSVANQLAAAHEEFKRPKLRVTHWREDKAGDGKILRIFDTHPGHAGQPVFLIAPPSLGLPVDAQTARSYAAWMNQNHEKGVVLCSVCAGSFVLAETGILSGRAATTHWSYAEAMSERFKDVDVDSDKLMIDDGDIITAGGFMAWTDVGLRIVQRVMGPGIMLETARFMLVDPPGREQRYYSSFSPNLHHGDASILKVQRWLQIKGAKDVSIDMMAKEALMETRTFLRRFYKATGFKPTEYCQHIRVAKAKELLEFTQQNMEQISWAVGYEDPGAFRKIFFKHTGLAPGDYRSRFSVNKLVL